MVRGFGFRLAAPVTKEFLKRNARNMFYQLEKRRKQNWPAASSYDQIWTSLRKLGHA